jgi:hypothetical protein
MVWRRTWSMRHDLSLDAIDVVDDVWRRVDELAVSAATDEQQRQVAVQEAQRRQVSADAESSIDQRKRSDFVDDVVEFVVVVVVVGAESFVGGGGARGERGVGSRRAADAERHDVNDGDAANSVACVVAAGIVVADDVDGRCERQRRQQSPVAPATPLDAGACDLVDGDGLVVDDSDIVIARHVIERLGARRHGRLCAVDAAQQRSSGSTSLLESKSNRNFFVLIFSLSLSLSLFSSKKSLFADSADVVVRLLPTNGLSSSSSSVTLVVRLSLNSSSFFS